MSVKHQLFFIRALIGMIFAAIVLIGGAFVVTGGEVGGVPTVSIIMLAFAIVAEQKLRAKLEADPNAR